MYDLLNLFQGCFFRVRLYVEVGENSKEKNRQSEVLFFVKIAVLFNPGLINVLGEYDCEKHKDWKGFSKIERQLNKNWLLCSTVQCAN